MHKIITNDKIQETLASIDPTRIVVAYIGRDWSSYIEKSTPREIIISPTIGSNPFAIKEIANTFGWGNVHFLDNLHAKFYIGEKCAFLGSPNLSRNGISTTGLYEIGVFISDEDSLLDLNKEFKKIKSQAIADYPTQEAKEEKLQQLLENHNRVFSEVPEPTTDQACTFLDYNPISHLDFGVVWYRHCEVKKNFEEIETQDPTLSKDTFDSVVGNWTTCLETDSVKNNSWILLWRSKKDGTPDKREKSLMWLYAHQTISHSIEDNPYSKIIIQRNDKKTPAEPFRIDDAFTTAFQKAISENEFLVFREKPEKEWSINECQDMMPQLLEEIRIRMIDLTPRAT
ncbi:hypothetical protein KRX52_06605 [Pseudomonas sp. MAP12]|uniref:Phospholipase D-like domain-containing protein n=1 Tax=Geopseudomonas aromaticivorans TaxID=2849492 RepID=A0ABS6MUJ4_9GAMM|nr:phospholipase D-like domain-containing protein [Pseudomonas aromaticivorans]MBV2132474.1 hypothetical protein [Pseudomonas aromaticivorans]